MHFRSTGGKVGVQAKHAGLSMETDVIPGVQENNFYINDNGTINVISSWNTFLLRCFSFPVPILIPPLFPTIYHFTPHVKKKKNTPISLLSQLGLHMGVQ